MIPILLILGAGAALEIKRLTQRPLGEESAHALREREKELKEILQALRKELDKEKEEHAAEVAKSEVLQRQADELAAEKERLAAQNDALRDRAEALAQTAESLLAEKGGVQKQLEQLKITAAEETAAAVESEAQLRQDIADALERFSAGALDADGFLDDLRDMGVQVDCTAEQLTLTCRQSESTSSAPIAPGTWSQSTRLVCGSSERIAQLISASTLRQDTPAERNATALLSIQNTPRDGTGTPRFSSLARGLPNTTIAALTPRLFGATGTSAAGVTLPSPESATDSAPAVQAEQPPVKEPVANNTYHVEAKSILFTRPSKGAASKKPPAVPRLGLNVALGSSAPADRATLASYAFQSEANDKFQSTSTDIIARS